MPQQLDVDVPTPDGTCPSVLTVPDGEGPWPAVIFFMDAGGVRSAMKHMCERLAGMGYVVLLPVMYYRHGPYEPFNVETVFSDPDERTRLFSLVMSVTKEMAASDTGAFLDFLDSRPEVAKGGVGTTGYCMGGGLSLTAAGRFPDRVAAAASFHGGHLAGDAPDSPHRIAGQIRGRVYVAAAKDDASFPPEQAEQLESALRDGGVDYTLVTYDAHHGFAVPDNATFDPAAAERHWEALADLYGSALSA